jgi:hypothetical protein
LSWDIQLGDWIEVLKAMPDNSVHCVVTSPPYWGLRDYGTGTWEGGEPDCDHKRKNVRPDHSGRTLTGRGLQASAVSSATPYKDACGICGAVRIDQQLGLETDPAEFVQKIVDGFREVRRVLRHDGVLWLNFGDCYATGTSASRPPGRRGISGNTQLAQDAVPRNGNPFGLKPKDLVGMPWRIAFALAGRWLVAAARHHLAQAEPDAGERCRIAARNRMSTSSCSPSQSDTSMTPRPLRNARVSTHTAAAMD